MAKPAEPEWLEPLICGQLTPQVDAPEHSASFNSTLSLAQVSTIAAMSGIDLSPHVHLVDPTVGEGTVLTTAAAALITAGHTVSALGQDINETAVESARLSVGSVATDCDIHYGDLLTDRTTFERAAELLVSEPPWGLSWAAQSDGVHRMVDLGYYRHGTGRTSDAAWLFVQRAIDLLRPASEGGGRAVLLVTPSFTFDRSGRSVRKYLCDEDLLEGLVRLPEGLAANTAIPLYLLILRSNKPKQLQGKAHVIDLRPFLTTSKRDRSRSLRADGLHVLWSSLARCRPGPHNRIVGFESFNYRQALVGSVTNESDCRWTLEVPQADTTRWLNARYGQVHVDVEPRGDSYFRFVADPSTTENSASPWPSTRLSALLSKPPGVVDANAPVSDSEHQAWNTTLWLPAASTQDASRTPPESLRGVARLAINDDLLDLDFLVAWLNSPGGRSARQVAARRLSTGAHFNTPSFHSGDSVWRFVDELSTPMPPLHEQTSVREAALTLTRAESMVTQARSELWARPSRADLLVRKFKPVFDDSLSSWVAELPYPFATALWTFASRKGVHEKHRQMFLTWESYASFLSAALLSVMQQDGGLAAAEGPALRRALDTAGLGIERATLGTWIVIIERLTAAYRKMLDSNDQDERARVQQLFGGASPSVIEALTARDGVELLKEAVSRRNAWSGHGGAASDLTLQKQVDHMTALLEKLRAVVGPAWSGLPLVRAGAARRREGMYAQDVEMVMGTRTPFEPDVMSVGTMMEEDELYLATDGCAEPVPLSHLVVLRSSPQNQRYSCYFFNRTDLSTARLVSYQVTDTEEIEEPLDQLDLHLPWLLGDGRGV